jgi:hypothetical protein
MENKEEIIIKENVKTVKVKKQNPYLKNKERNKELT